MERFPDTVVQSLSTLLSSDRSLVNCVLEVTSHKEIRSGWHNPAKPISDIQNGIGSKATKEQSVLWADVTLVQVASDYPTLRQRSVEQVLNNIHRRLGDAAVDRYVYDEWLAAATVVDDFPATTEHATLFHQATAHYEALSSQFPCEAACSVVTVCDVIVEACVRAATTLSSDDIERIKEENEDSDEALDTSIVGLWNKMDAQASAKASALLDTECNLLRVIYHGDEAAMRLELYNIGECHVGGRSLLSIERHMLEDCARIPGGRGRAGMPREPVKSDSERGAELNELLTFLNTLEGTTGEIGGSESGENAAAAAAAAAAVTVTPEQLSHTRTVNLFQDMLFRYDRNGADIWRERGTLHQRKYCETLGPTTLVQVMTRAMLDSDQTLTAYDPDTDQILVACHTRTWDRRRHTSRFRTSDTTTGYCSVPPGFARWRDARERRLRAKTAAQRQALADLHEQARLSKEKKDPAAMEQKERAIAASVTRNSSLSAPVLFQMGKKEANDVEDEIVSLYPADNAVVRFYRMGINGSKEKYRWASVSKDGHTFGLRPQINVPRVHNGLHGVPLEEGQDRQKENNKKRTNNEIGQVFAANFVDGSRCTVEKGPDAPVKPDGNGTVNLSYTSTCTGLVVECCSDGSTRQRIVGIGSTVANEEFCRVITSQGQVIRYLKNGGIEVLLSDGNVCRWMVPDKISDDRASSASSPLLPGWVVTNNNGQRTRAVPRPRDTSKKESRGDDVTFQSVEEWKKQWRYVVEESPIQTNMTTDSLVLSRIVEREDGTRIITEPEGTRRGKWFHQKVVSLQ
jgi:hypothetical protein